MASRLADLLLDGIEACEKLKTHVSTTPAHRNFYGVANLYRRSLLADLKSRLEHSS